MPQQKIFPSSNFNLSSNAVKFGCEYWVNCVKLFFEMDIMEYTKNR